MQINWKVKAFIYKILFIFRAQNILFFIQKKITKRANVKINEINDFWKYHLHNLEIFNSINILEFGAGKTLEQNIFLNYKLSNKFSQTVIDSSKMLDTNLFNQANEQIAKILNVKVNTNVNSIQDIKKFYNIKYLAPCNIESLKEKNTIFDACISSVTLEHLPESELKKVFVFLKKIIKKGKIISLIIDYSDHYCHTDSKISPLNFLQFDEKDWKKYNTPYLYQNRLRHQDYRKFFQQMGFDIVHEKKGNIGKPPNIISNKFDTNDEETYILWGTFTLKNI